MLVRQDTCTPDGRYRTSHITSLVPYDLPSLQRCSFLGHRRTSVKRLYIGRSPLGATESVLTALKRALHPHTSAVRYSAAVSHRVLMTPAVQWLPTAISGKESQYVGVRLPTIQRAPLALNPLASEGRPMYNSKNRFSRLWVPTKKESKQKPYSHPSSIVRPVNYQAPMRARFSSATSKRQ